MEAPQTSCLEEDRILEFGDICDDHSYEEVVDGEGAEYYNRDEQDHHERSSYLVLRECI